MAPYLSSARRATEIHGREGVEPTGAGLPALLDRRCVPLALLGQRRRWLRLAIAVHEQGGPAAALTRALMEAELAEVERLLERARHDEAEAAAGRPGATIPHHLCPLEPASGVMAPRKREAVILYGLHRPVPVIARLMVISSRSVHNHLDTARDDWGVPRSVLGMRTADHFRQVACPHLAELRAASPLIGA